MANSRSSLRSPSASDPLMRLRVRETAAPGVAPATPLESPIASLDADLPWNADEALRREMERLENSRDFAVGSGLAAVPPDPFAVAPPPSSELDPLAGIDGVSRPATPLGRSGVIPMPGVSARPFPNPPVASDDLERLKVENDELHKLVEEMKQIFAQASEQEIENGKTIESLRHRVAELEELLAQKERQCELATAQIQELEHQLRQPPPPPPSEDELSKMADELEKERCQLAQDRKTLEAERHQLRDDEEEMMRQMREMEVQMARERAEIARQRTELQRLHSDIKRELDSLHGSDRALTDRLAQFQRRHQELLHRTGAQPAPSAAHAAAAAPEPSTDGKKDAGLLGRLFGRK